MANNRRNRLGEFLSALPVVLRRCCALLLALHGSSLFAAGGNFGGGNGSVNAPYLIEDLADLAAIEKLTPAIKEKIERIVQKKKADGAWITIDEKTTHDQMIAQGTLEKEVFSSVAYFKLTKDIDASDTRKPGTDYWNNGRGFPPITAFYGTLDGNGYVISRLFIDRSVPTSKNQQKRITDVAAFAVSNYGVIRNLGLSDCNIEGYNQAATFAGSNNGLISHCYATGTVSLSIAGEKDFRRGGFYHTYVTGICCTNGWYGQVYHSFSSCTLSADKCLYECNAGGIVSWAGAGGEISGIAAIDQAFFTGEINLSKTHNASTGGLVAVLGLRAGLENKSEYMLSILRRSFSMASIDSVGLVGGICSLASPTGIADTNPKNEERNFVIIGECFTSNTINAGGMTISVGGLVCSYENVNLNVRSNIPFINCYASTRITAKSNKTSITGLINSLWTQFDVPAVQNCYSASTLRNLDDERKKDRKQSFFIPLFERTILENEKQRIQISGAPQLVKDCFWQCDKESYDKYLRPYDKGQPLVPALEDHAKSVQLGKPLYPKDFKNRTAFRGWDFQKVWYKHDNEMPKLRRVIHPGNYFLRLENRDGK